MNLKVQKRIASQAANCSPKRVVFDPDRTGEIKEAITKADIRGLIHDRAIIIKQKKGVSKARARNIKVQKRKGRQQGMGSRKGKFNARMPHKRLWINRIRLQRSYLHMLKEKNAIEHDVYRDLYLKAKGGFFRSKRHIELYLTERGMIKQEEPTKELI